MYVFIISVESVCILLAGVMGLGGVYFVGEKWS